jgi:hypothetical protein
LLCALYNSRKNMLMPAMYTVKVADADYSGIPVCGNLLQMAKDEHR